MPAELVDVEVLFDDDVVDTFTSRLDPDSRTDLDAFLKDMKARVSPKDGGAVKITRRSVSLGTYHIATGRKIRD